MGAHPAWRMLWSLSLPLAVAQRRTTIDTHFFFFFSADASGPAIVAIIREEGQRSEAAALFVQTLLCGPCVMCGCGCVLARNQAID